jgi:hypothetical protein
VFALNENGREQAGMGLAVGDYDNDGELIFTSQTFQTTQTSSITTTALEIFPTSPFHLVLVK